MKIYDKAEWQIDGGVDKSSVAQHFKLLFNWLSTKGLLNNDGHEILELDAYGDTSLHSDLLTDEGNSFVEKTYDEVVKSHRYGTEDFIKALEERYTKKS